MSQRVILAGTEYEYSDVELVQMMELGIIRSVGKQWALEPPPPFINERNRLVHAVGAESLNEANEYGSAFSRALVVNTTGAHHTVIVSGTASIDPWGNTLHKGDFGAQMWRTLYNITGLLKNAQTGWHNVVRTSCFLRDIERDYKQFNQIRTLFYNWLGVHPYPASIGIQAVLCRSDLLVEIEAQALTYYQPERH